MKPFLTNEPLPDRLTVLPPEIAFPDMSFPLSARELHQYFVYGTHSHRGFMEIVLITGGRANHTSGTFRHPIMVGDLLVIPEGVEHGYDTIGDLRYYNILFDPYKLKLPLDDLAQVPGASELLSLNSDKYLRFCHLDNTDFEKARLMALDLRNTLATRLPGMRFAAQGKLMVLLDFLSRAFAKSGEYYPPPQAGRLNELMQEMENKYSLEWNIEEMCRITSLSRPILFREFKKICNTSPMDYLLSIRMRHACMMLSQTTLSVSEIATACGFIDSSYFIYRFRKRTGLTPKDFRLAVLEQNPAS